MTDTTAEAGAAAQAQGRAREHEAEALVHRLLSTVQRAAVDIWHVGRFLLFALYTLIRVVSIWLWLVAAAFGVLAFVSRLIGTVLLWLAGGVPPPPGGHAPSMQSMLQQDLQRFWNSRLVLYREIAQPLAFNLVIARRGLRTFWHWHIWRKAFALLIFGVFIGIPASYVIPRPHDVQITDDNALSHEGGQTRYLIHAVDIDNPDRTREYENEIAPWLLKINPQGVKSRLQNGRFYRLWVVGLRWYYMPMLFPNIIAVTEIDRFGQPIDRSRPVPAPKSEAGPGF
jgi:hypothetical protein